MANLNTALTPSPVVTVLNKDGSTATGYTGNVTMALGTNPTAATLGGTVTVAASSGVATFSNLTLNRSGKNFTLRATAAAQGGYTPKARVSRPFSIPTRCVFTTQPVGVAAAGDILPTFTVTIQDGAGNTDTSYTGADVTVALYTGAGSGVLSGFYTRTATAGVVDFSGLSIDADGTYSLRATAESVSTAYDPAPAISSTFTIPSVNFTLVAGSSGAQSGYVEGVFGTLTPTTINGYTIPGIISDSFFDYVTLTINQTLSQNYFTSVTIGSTTYTSASATFEGLPGQSTWIWEGEQYTFVDSSSYSVVFVLP